MRHWKEIKNSCKINYNNIFTSILIPLIVVLGIWFFALCYLGKTIIGDLGSIIYRIDSITFVGLTGQNFL